MFSGYLLKDLYVFETLIGSGGMGEVWSARRTSLGDRVAIKVLKLGSFQNFENIRNKLKKEAEITSVLNHPNICKVFEFVEQENLCFLIMELLEGYDLQALIRNPNALKGVDRTCLALYVAKEVLRALHVAHNIKHPTFNRILHQDLKPANIFITKHGEVKLLDLGVAKIEQDLESAITSNSFFSMHYTSPELWSNGNYFSKNYTTQNDLYSLGLVFYEIITGKKAYSGSGFELISKIEKGNVPSIESYCESVELSRVFSKWTNKIPSARFEDTKTILSIVSDFVLDFHISESIVLDIFKRVESGQYIEADITEKIYTIPNVENDFNDNGSSMKISKTGQLQDSTGREAEEDVLKAIEEVYGKENTRIFVNSTIPDRNKTPDFVIPIFDQKGVFKLLIVECKASTTLYPDGTTKFSDPFAQILSYRDRLQRSLKLMNRECEFLCYVVFPNRNEIPKNLKDGRDGVIWMTNQNFKEYLRGYRPVTPRDEKWELVQMIYEKKEIIQKYREKLYFSKEQEKILSWKYGGTKRITGLAGTGKSLVLAKKLVKDILESNGDNFLYLTHNNNLLLKFQDYIKKFLEEEDINLINTTQERSATKFNCEFKGRKFSITFCTFDAFSTSCVTESMDRILFQKQSYGPLFKKSSEARGAWPKEDDYTKEREELINILAPMKSGRENIFERYSALYVDEFQDCRIDSSRLRFPALFVQRSENGEPNLCFTEDSLQSFVKYKVLQEIDDSFDDIKKCELATNSSLGLPPLTNKSKNLDTIYRTPEKIFKLTLNILENQGGLLKNKADKILSLQFKNFHGEYFIIEESEVLGSVAFMLNDRQRFQDDIIFIESLEHRKSSDLFDRINTKYKCNDVVNKQPPIAEAINFFHEFNVRGLESKVVYLIIDEGLIEKPNYIYTLVCRTKVDLVLVRSNSLSKDKFEKFISFMVDKQYKKAS